MAGELSLPGGHSYTGTSSRSGRSVAKLELLLPERNCLRMRGTIGKQGKKNSKKGKKLLGRHSSFLQFDSKPVNRRFLTPKEGVDAALRKFKEIWSTKASLPQAALQALATIKKNYPHLEVNKLHTDPGHVPGVAVHKCFSFRAELCLVGLHRRPQAGICWTEVSDGNGDLITIALSIVVSGGYEDDKDEGEILTYTGEGGKDQTTGRQIENQKREGGNLALQNSCITKNSVRVIRGRKDPNSLSKMTYSYDGLYKVVSGKPERGISGFEVFKFKLVREVDGQPPLSWHSPAPSPRHRIARGFESPPRYFRSRMDYGGHNSSRARQIS